MRNSQRTGNRTRGATERGEATAIASRDSSSDLAILLVSVPPNKHSARCSTRSWRILTNTAPRISFAMHQKVYRSPPLAQDWPLKAMFPTSALNWMPISDPSWAETIHHSEHGLARSIQRTVPLSLMVMTTSIPRGTGRTTISSRSTKTGFGHRARDHRDKTQYGPVQSQSRVTLINTPGVVTMRMDHNAQLCARDDRLDLKAALDFNTNTIWNANVIES